jgi:hypothetical protein
VVVEVAQEREVEVLHLLLEVQAVAVLEKLQHKTEPQELQIKVALVEMVLAKQVVALLQVAVAVLMLLAVTLLQRPMLSQVRVVQELPYLSQVHLSLMLEAEAVVLDIMEVKQAFLVLAVLAVEETEPVGRNH